MIRSLLSTCCTILLLLMLLFPARAQAQEVQVPLSPDSTVTTIDAELRQTLSLFPDVTGFQQAELYRVSENQYELVIEYREGAQVLRERRSLSAEEVEQLRQRVAQQMRATGTRVGLNQEGQVGLTAATTFLGLVEGGLLAGALGAESESAAALPLMGGALGFFIPLLATQNAEVTESEADMTFYGGIQGYAHAAQLTALMGDDPDGQAVAGLAAVLGGVEATAGYLTARNNQWSGGHAEMVSLNGISGNLIGLGLGATLADDAGDNSRIGAGMSLLGSVAGAYFGHRMGRSDRYTQGDARIYFQTGTQAVNLVGSLVAASDVEGGQFVAGLLTTTGVGGLALGHVLIRDRDFTKDEANLVFLGSTAGSLLGGGLAALSDAEGSAVAVMQALGSATGFGITYSLFGSEARQRTSISAAGMDVKLRLEPHVNTPIGADRSAGSLSNRVVPKLTLRASF